MGDRTEELKRTLDEAVAEYARKDRPDSDPRTFDTGQASTVGSYTEDWSGVWRR